MGWGWGWGLGGEHTHIHRAALRGRGSAGRGRGSAGRRRLLRSVAARGGEGGKEGGGRRPPLFGHPRSTRPRAFRAPLRALSAPPTPPRPPASSPVPGCGEEDGGHPANLPPPPPGSGTQVRPLCIAVIPGRVPPLQWAIPPSHPAPRGLEWMWRGPGNKGHQACRAPAADIFSDGGADTSIPAEPPN